MGFLRFLEGVRSPLVSALMAAVTYFGDETVFMALALAVFWCVSKRQGYYIFAVGLGGTVVNQWLKLAFRVPRPWVLDPGFTIVESARAGATGYSFPSGHTQNVVGTLGCLALANRQTWLRVLCAAFLVLVPFSRMYLGVHTPLDVGAAFLTAAVLVLALWRCFRDDGAFRRSIWTVLWAMLALAACYAAWASLTAFPAGADAENVAHGIKNGWTLLGCVLGLIASRWYDEKKLRFDVRAPFWGQTGKLTLGLALLLGVRAGLKPVLNALFQGSAAADHPTLYLMVTSGLRYFLMVVFALCIWPMTFPLFAGRKKRGLS